jgi:probable F420-dependent oxidoreductase
LGAPDLPDCDPYRIFSGKDAVRCQETNRAVAELPGRWRMNAERFRFLAPMPRLGGGARRWAAELRRIEDLGFHSVTVSEHYSHGWAMDALTAMSFALASTSRLRAMPLVLNNDLHNPAALAKAIATADVLSVGRAAIGLGAGWLEADYKALGAGYDAASVRIARLEEALQVITAFFAGGLVTFHGHHYKLDGLEALPCPVQDPRPPILVGGGGPKMLDLAARYADIVGVHARLGPDGLDQGAAKGLSRASIDEKIGLVATAASRADCQVPEIQFTCYDVNIGGVQVTPIRPSFSDFIAARPGDFADSPASLHGNVDKCVDDLRRWKEELGISYWNLGGNVDAVAPIVARLSAE